MNIRFTFCLIMSGLVMTGCSRHSSPQAARPQEYGQIYESTQGSNVVYYARSSNDSGGFWYWMYALGSLGSSSGYSSSSASPSYFSSGAWQKVPSPPDNLKPTEEVVKEEGGMPTPVVEPDSEVPEKDVITEDTTEQQEEAMENEGGQVAPDTESADSQPEADSKEDSSGSDNEMGSGDSSGGGDSDSGDSGGGDSGGGDGGGGGDGD